MTADRSLWQFLRRKVALPLWQAAILWFICASAAGQGLFVIVGWLS